MNGYLDAVEKQIITSELTKENQISDGIYTLPMTNVEVKGSKPTSGWIVIQNSEVKNYSMVMNDYVVTKVVKQSKVQKLVDQYGILDIYNSRKCCLWLVCVGRE